MQCTDATQPKSTHATVGLAPSLLPATAAFPCCFALLTWQLTTTHPCLLLLVLVIFPKLCTRGCTLRLLGNVSLLIVWRIVRRSLAPPTCKSGVIWV